jgi:hypothetical protein
MARVQCPEYASPEYASEVSEQDAALAPAALTRPASAPRRKRHPLMWVGIAAILPVLGWDAWRTQREIQQRHQESPRAASPVWVKHDTARSGHADHE